MLKGQRNFNVVGGAGYIGLFMLAILLANPLIGMSVNALEEDQVSENNDIALQAITQSVVGISFSRVASDGTVTIIPDGETAGSSVIPVDSNGAKAKVDVRATVHVQNSSGYSVYVGSNSSQLKNGDNVIDSVTSETDYVDLPVNSWGFSFSKTDKVNDKYNAMPSTVRGNALDINNGPLIRDETKTYTLSFAANIGSDKPAGTYTNGITLSVVSSPLEVVLAPVYNEFSVDYMQDMTSAVCSGATIGTTGQLYDKRDNKPYWVTKLADGHCWMTQNLELDLSSSKDLTPEDSDIIANWHPEFSTTTDLEESGTDDVRVYTGTRSWSQPGYVLDTPYEIRPGSYYATVLPDSSNTGLVDFGSRLASTDKDFYSKAEYLGFDGVTQCNKTANTAISVAISGVCAQYDAHYALGNYYQWNAATAGSGAGLIQNPSYSAPTTVNDLKNAESSICPAGWRLPVGGGVGDSPFNQDGSFGRLLQSYGWSGTQDSNLLVKGPVFLTRSGNVYNNNGVGLREIGRAGIYWTASSQQPGNQCPFNYSINGNGVVNAKDSYGYAYTGASVRCIAR